MRVRRKPSPMTKHRCQPTDEQRRTVKTLAGYGIKASQIASILGLHSEITLRKHFREELSLGPLEASANVMRTAFQLASSGRDPAMTIFWLKTRGRWSERGSEEGAESPRTVVYGWVSPKS